MTKKVPKSQKRPKRQAAAPADDEQAADVLETGNLNSPDRAQTGSDETVHSAGSESPPSYSPVENTCDEFREMMREMMAEFAAMMKTELTALRSKIQIDTQAVVEKVLGEKLDKVAKTVDKVAKTFESLDARMSAAEGHLLSQPPAPPARPTNDIDVFRVREDGYTAAERCAERLARESEAERYARDERYLTLGEQVLRNPLIRDLSIRGLNPFKLSDLQHILNLRGFYKLLPDVDLKECYFEGACGFRKEEFALAEWREMSVEEMKRKVREAHPFFGGRPVYPPGKVDVDTLETKEEIVRAFWALTYVPWQVYQTAVGGAHVLRLAKAGDVGEDPEVVGSYLAWACRAGLDLPVIRGLAEKCRKDGIDLAAGRAATGGHTDVLDLLASEFGARIGVYCLTYASTRGRDAMIDHLVEKYGVDPNGGGEYGWTALHDAASRGRVRTVKHLIEKYNVDIHTRDRYGKTALDWAESNGMTECAAVLRGYGATNGEPVEEEAWTENDWDSDDNSDADHDVM